MYHIESLSQHFEKEIYQYVNISLQKRTPFFSEDLLVAASYRKTPVLESLFNSEFCEISKSTYFEEHLRTTASENLFMKLTKIRIYNEF